MSPRLAEEAGVRAPRPLLAWAMLAMLVGLVLIAYLDKALLGLVAQPVKEDLGLSSAEFGLIGSAVFLLGPVAALLYGFIADRVPAKATLVVLALIWSFAQLPIFFTASFGMLIGTRLVLGLAVGPAQPAAHAIAYSWFPNECRGLPAALLTTGASIAKLLLAPILTIVIVVFGWQAGFLAVALLGVAWATIWAMIGKQGPYGSGAQQQDETSGVRVPFRHILVTRTFLGSVLGVFLASLVASVVLVWLPSYFENALGFSRVMAGSLFGLPSITAMAFLLVVGSISDRMLRRGATSRAARGKIGAAILIAGGLFLVCIPYGGSVPVTLALFMMGYGLVVTILAVTVPPAAEIVSPVQRASTVAFALAIGNAGDFVGPWITGLVLDAAETPVAGYGAAFQLLGGIVVIGGVLFGVLINPERDAAKIAAIQSRI